MELWSLLSNIWPLKCEPTIRDDVKLFESCINDIVRTIKVASIENILVEVNSLHPKRKFALKVEGNKKPSFLGMCIEHNNNVLSSTWYCEPRHFMKTHTFFFQTFQKCGLSKKNWTGIWSFLYYQKIWYFFFSGNMIFFFRRKRKDNVSQKNASIYVFSKCSEKMEYYHFCNIWKYGISFPKISYFFFRRKTKDDLCQETHRNMMFSVYMYKCICAKRMLPLW